MKSLDEKIRQKVFFPLFWQLENSTPPNIPPQYQFYCTFRLSRFFFTKPNITVPFSNVNFLFSLIFMLTLEKGDWFERNILSGGNGYCDFMIHSLHSQKTCDIVSRS